MNQNLDLKNLVPQLKEIAQKLTRYVGIIFFVLIASIYIFILFRINSLSNAQPDSSTIGQNTTPTLRINEKVADQLQQLEDNSVNVQALFDEARSNPFQE